MNEYENLKTDFEAVKKEYEKWLDTVIDLHRKENALSDALEGIKGYSVSDEVPISKGIEKLAFYLQLPITYDPNWSKNYPDLGEKRIIYKGVVVYELWHKGRE